ncbi:hypothetical protein MCOR25_009997 [Pyricularia grisea]|nr:hypothetical protein MCOR25_009997 [Pyricularia grisea]
MAHAAISYMQQRQEAGANAFLAAVKKESRFDPMGHFLALKVAHQELAHPSTATNATARCRVEAQIGSLENCWSKITFGTRRGGRAQQGAVYHGRRRGAVRGRGRGLWRGCRAPSSPTITRRAGGWKGGPSEGLGARTWEDVGRENVARSWRCDGCGDGGHYH